MGETDDHVTFDIEAHSESPTKTVVETRDFEWIIDESEVMGGTNDGPNPVEHLLGATAGCVTVAGHVVADEMELELRGLEMEIAGDINPVKIEGERTDDRAGYREVRVDIEVDTDADRDALDEWLSRVVTRCPVCDNVENETPIDLSVSAT